MIISDDDDFVCFVKQQVEACFQKVLCTPDGQNNVMCLQFRMPHRLEGKLPLCLEFQDERIVIDHPSPFMIPLAISRRPPEEQDKFEHWKDTANRFFSDRKGRHNSVSHCPKMAESMSRANLLRHGEIVSSGRHLPASFET